MMQVTNNYQDLSTYQKPVTIQPVPQKDKLPSDLELSPEKKLEIGNAIDEKKSTIVEMNQEQKDKARNSMVNIIDHQSKKSQVEIYLSVAQDNKVESNDTLDAINTLRDVQKQNNTVAAYATYKENQGNVTPSPMEV